MENMGDVNKFIDNFNVSFRKSAHGEILVATSKNLKPGK